MLLGLLILIFTAYFYSYTLNHFYVLATKMGEVINGLEAKIVDLISKVTTLTIVNSILTVISSLLFRNSSLVL